MSNRHKRRLHRLFYKHRYVDMYGINQHYMTCISKITLAIKYYRLVNGRYVPSSIDQIYKSVDSSGEYNI
jgi:hypothetical protein